MMASELEAGESIFDGRCQLPVMTVSEPALANNIALMARYCAAANVSLAPHVKTTMCSEIALRQLAAGAWGVTVATVQQALALRRRPGFSRILLANEIIDEAGLRAIARILADDSELEMISLADSVEAVRRMDHYLTAESSLARLKVMVEVGYPGARSGCRTLDNLLAVAKAIRDSASLELAGVETYEGVVARTADEESQRKVRSFVNEALMGHKALQDRGWISKTDWFSAGGSVFFKEVIEAWTEISVESRPPLLLRSGCYVTHDSGRYHRLSPLDGRAPARAPRLLPAIEVWGPVLSMPEPEFAVVGIGKRDVSTDSDPPVALKVQHDSRLPELIATAPEVLGIYDQHLMLRVPPDVDLKVGSLVGVGISHPCTTFDKWHRIALVDDCYRLLSWLETDFH